MSDRRMPEGRRPVKRRDPSKTELKRRQLILEVAKETGRECALAIVRAQKVMLVEDGEGLLNQGARLMLERLVEVGALRIGAYEATAQYLAAFGNDGQALRYAGQQVYPLDVDPETL